jgi:hypothetical protein
MTQLPSFAEHADTLWHALRRQVLGEHTDQTGWLTEKAEARDGPWVVTLDAHYEPHYRYEAIGTRFRAAYTNPLGFRFNIYHASVWSGVAKLLGMQDVLCGDDRLDRTFIIRSNQPERVRRLLDDQRLRDQLLIEPETHLHVRDSGDWFADRFPAGVDELVLEVEGRVTDESRLHRLYGLFSEALESLMRLPSGDSGLPT